MSNSATPWTEPTRLLHPWDSPGKNTAVGCHVLLRGIFLTQGSLTFLITWLGPGRVRGLRSGETQVGLHLDSRFSRVPAGGCNSCRLGPTFCLRERPYLSPPHLRLSSLHGLRTSVCGQSWEPSSQIVPTAKGLEIILAGG